MKASEVEDTVVRTVLLHKLEERSFDINEKEDGK
jgi:hypothetical protein